MISDFNYFNQPEQPILTLCNPDDTELGIITNAEEVSLSIRFNDISDLSYKIFQSDDEEYNDRVYNKHIERRQVSVAGVGYFIITGVNEVEDDTGVYKNVQAKSCEYELNNIAAPYINGTYCLYKPENFDAESNEQIAQRDDEYLNQNCILYEVMKVIPSWRLEQLNFVEGDDKYKDLASAFRTFESSDTTVYSFFKTEIQENYDCFVEFDIENRVVRVLHYDDVFVEEPVILSKANVLNSCEVSTTIDSYVNSLNVEGQDGVSIASCNPMGNTTIYNFDHDINTGLIDGVLKDALIYWKNNLKTSPDFSLEENQWILLPEFVSEWSGLDSALLDAQEDLLEVASDGIKLKITGEDLHQFVYSNMCSKYNDEEPIFSTLLNKVRWWYDENYSWMSEESRNAFVAYGKSCDLRSAIETIVHPSDNGIDVSGLSDEDYVKNIELFFNQSTILAKALFMRDLAIYGQKEIFADTLEAFNRLLLCAQSSLEKIKTEDSKLDSYLSGYEAQLASLETTVVEGTADRAALDEQTTLLQNYISSVKNAKSIYKEVSDKLSETIAYIQNKIGGIYNHNSFEGSFKEFLNEHPEHTITASELYAKLTRYFKQQTYTNDTIVITDAMEDTEKYAQERDLYNESVDLLKEISIPAYEVSISAESFMFSTDFREILKNMSIKSAFYIELPNNDVPLFHLLEININYEEKSCELKFGNRLNISDPAAILSELQATASSAASVVAAERINWGISEDKINLLMELKSADIDTTFRMMKNSINNTSLGADGLRCYATDEDGNPTYGFWGANGVLMFTDENNSPKMAVGRILRNDGEKDYYEYGLYGQSIIANTISADKLVAGTLSKGNNYIRNGSFETGYVPVRGKNYIKNGSFEQYTSSDMYGTVLTEWVDNISPGYRFVDDIPSGAKIPLGEHYYTARLADFDSNGIISSGYVSDASQVIDQPLPPDTYTLSFYYRQNPDYSGDSIIIPSVKLYNSSTLIVSLEPSDNDVEVDCDGEKWRRCSTSFSISEELTNTTVVLYCDISYCVDGILLESGNSLNAYSDYLGVSPVDIDFWSSGLNSVSLYEKPTPVGSKCLSTLTYRDGRISQSISCPIDKGTYTLSFYYCVDNGISENPYVYICQSGSITPLLNCGYNDNKESLEIDGVVWYRCYKTVSLSSPIANPVAIVHCPTGVYIDGVMLEKSAVLHEFSPYMGELFAKYTTIDDNGVTIYNGKLKILNNDGVTVFEADDDGNLVMSGTIKARSGEIGGWKIEEKELNFEAELNGETVAAGMSTRGDAIFYAGRRKLTDTTARVNFRVSQDGFLYTRNAQIADSLQIIESDPTTGDISSNPYSIDISGMGISMRYRNNSRRSGIFFACPDNGITGGASNSDLALMGYSRILFGVQPSSGTWEHICTMGTEGSTLCFYPAKTSNSDTDATEAYLGTKERPWTSLYMKSTLAKITKKIEPRAITYLTVGNIPVTRYVLCETLDIDI